MDAARLIGEILAHDRLPSPDAAALEIARLAAQPEIDGARIRRVVAADPAICARVLRTANSVLHGLRQPAATIDQAVTVLGMRAVARAAVTFSVLERHRSGLAEFDYQGFWAESLACAVGARVLAARTAFPGPDEAFTYGLLRAIGRLALVAVYPQQYRSVLLTLGTCDSRELADAERSVFGVDAELLSAAMLRAWGLPRLHVAMAGEGEAGSAAAGGQARLLALCRLAGDLARIMVYPEVDQRQLGDLARAVAAFGIAVERAPEMFGEIAVLYADLGTHLDIATPDVPMLAEVYAKASMGR